MYCNWFDKQSKIIKILLQIPFWGWVFSALYRIFKYVANKDHSNVVTLIFGILCIIPIVGFVLSICDLVTVIISDKITVLAD